MLSIVAGATQQQQNMGLEFPSFPRSSGVMPRMAHKILYLTSVSFLASTIRNRSLPRTAE
jgi:hypothetical protein